MKTNKQTQLLIKDETVQPDSLIEMAIKQGTSVEQLSLLLDMHLKIKSENARMDYIKALIEFQSIVTPVKKVGAVNYQNGRGGSVNFKFAPLPEIIAHITPFLYKCGLSIQWKNEEIENKMRVTCIVAHINGHSESTSMSGEPDTSGGKNNIQAKGSTMTYLQRYTLNSILALPTEEDTDGSGGAPVTKPTPNAEQWSNITKKVREGVSIAKVQEHFNLSEDQIKYLNENK